MQDAFFNFPATATTLSSHPHSDHIVFKHAGRVHEMGPAEQIFADSQTAALKQFVSALH